MLSISTVGLHRIPNFVDQGLDPGLVAIATAMDAAAGGVSTVAMGLLTERIPSRFMGSIAFTFLAVAIYFTIIGDTILLMFVSFILFGAGIGGLMLLNSFLWADYFGRLHLGSIRGIVMPITMFFSALGAPLAGFIRDTTGTYDNIWWLSVVIMLIATAILASTGRPIKTPGFVQPRKSI
jgi:MFS family permease